MIGPNRARYNLSTCRFAPDDDYTNSHDPTINLTFLKVIGKLLIEFLIGRVLEGAFERILHLMISSCQKLLRTVEKLLPSIGMYVIAGYQPGFFYYLQ